MQGERNGFSQSRSADHVDEPVLIHRTLPAAVGDWMARPRFPARVSARDRFDCQIVVTDRTGCPVVGAEVMFASDEAIHGDCARTDKAGRVILSVAVAREPLGDALIIDAPGFLPLIINQPRLAPLTGQMGQIANTVTLDRSVSATVDDICWAIEAMQLDRATLSAPLGSRAPHVGVICASLPGQPASASAPDLRAAQEILQRMGTEVKVTPLALSSRPSVSEVMAALEVMATLAVDLIVLGVSPRSVNATLERQLESLRQAGILVLVPTDDPATLRKSWSDQAEIVSVGALALTSSGFSALALPATAHLQLTAPGVSIRIGHSLRSGAFLAAVHLAGFLSCLLLSEGLTRPALARIRVGRVLKALARSSTPVVPGQSDSGRMPIWGGVDFSACTS